jgi:hypothetical protein
MKREHYIIAAEFCSFHNIEMDFLYSLDENGFIRLERSDEDVYIMEDQLPGLEKIINFHYELGINLEGIETILDLLNRADKMQEEIIMLKNRLSFYESI